MAYSIYTILFENPKLCVSKIHDSCLTIIPKLEDPTKLQRIDQKFRCNMEVCAPVMQGAAPQQRPERKPVLMG